jgi:DNA mismatch endonuclease (patch repair protein)
MAAQRRVDTAPELAIRRLLHAAGLRYRVHRAPVESLARRRADIVFGGPRVAVFVDGCFWHRCPTHRTEPTANAEWWAAKLDRNVARDRETDAALESHGWMVIRVWEHEDPGQAAARICRAVRDRQGTF